MKFGNRRCTGRSINAEAANFPLLLLLPFLSFMLKQFMQILLRTCRYRTATKNISRDSQDTAFFQSFLCTFHFAFAQRGLTTQRKCRI
jgi:hypothetical protein